MKPAKARCSRIHSPRPDSFPGRLVAVSKSANVDGLRTTTLTLVPTLGDSTEIDMSNGRALAWSD